MRTIDEQAIKSTSFRQRILRDGRLLLRIAHMLYAYLIGGRRIRRVYRAKESRGEVFLVDEEMPS
ncbi:MAG TPA: hypothetical protein EYQ20_07245 [candidate division Zixibacteria bacterium]|jgi:hypothetical protein|nr:hypothetical protein [Candidatus Latescibacterota bacterium]MDP7239138.1 hypothetical protein [Candidatus Latescibacterota bacterium]HIG46213.1 hypothetical protein [candidate division Zixibacteria bacterium]